MWWLLLFRSAEVIARKAGTEAATQACFLPSGSEQRASTSARLVAAKCIRRIGCSSRHGSGGGRPELTVVEF